MEHSLSKSRVWIWALWLPAAVALAIPPFLSQIAAKQVHPLARILLLLAMAAAIPLWLAFRRRWSGVELGLLAMAMLAPPLFRAPRATVVTLAILAAACAFGRCCCDWLKLPLKHRSSEIAMSAGIGFTAWMVVLIALGLAGMIIAPAIAAAVGLALIVFRRGLVRIGRTASQIFRDWREPDALSGIQTMFLGAMILVLQPVVLTPSLLYDALATHLAASKSFSLHHTLAPYGEYGFLPQGYELMMGAAHTLAGQAAEQMVAPVFLALAFLAMYAIVRELGGRPKTALAGATLATALPFIQWNGAVAKNDICMAFFLLVALLASLRWITSGEPGWILAGAFAAAGAENIKHTALVGAAPLAVLFLIGAARRPRAARTITQAAAVFLVFGSFWMLRAAVLRGDPLYPLRAPGGDARSAEVLPSVKDRIAYAASLQFQGMPIYEGNSDTRLGPFFLLFLPGVLWFRRGDWSRGALACGFFIAVYLALWISSWPALRYAAAPVALLAVGLTEGLVRAIEGAPARLGSALLAAVCFCHLLDFSNLAGMSLNRARLEYMARRMDDNAYLSQSLPAYAAIQWTGRHADRGRLTLAIGADAAAYAEDPRTMASLFSGEGPFPPEEVRRAIAGANYEYVIIPRKADLAAIFGAKTPQFEDSRFAVFRLP